MKKLVLITLSYPYEIGAEQTFLEQELRYCRQAFGEVLLMPTRTSGRQYTLPEGIGVDLSLAAHAAATGWASLLLRLADNPRFLLKELLSAKVLARPWQRGKAALKNYLLVMSYLRFFRRFTWNGSPAILYTYWFTPVTTAAALYALSNRGVRVLSRAHGLDLYEERSRDYLPFRRQSLELLDAVALVSDQGRHYLSRLYPGLAHKFATHVIGSADGGVTAMPSEPGRLSLVSCSTLDANKRVHLIIEALEQLAQLRPGLIIGWHHFGTGPLEEELLQQATLRLGARVHHRFHGQVSPGELMAFYRDTPVDLFITTSASEGGRPVSIAEALSCSVPVVATAVGGIPELVEPANGLLLDKDAGPAQIAAGMAALLSEPAALAARRQQARVTWEQRCDARRVCPAFISFLDTLCQQPA